MPILAFTLLKVRTQYTTTKRSCVRYMKRCLIHEAVVASSCRYPPNGSTVHQHRTLLKKTLATDFNQTKTTFLHFFSFSTRYSGCRGGRSARHNYTYPWATHVTSIDKATVIGLILNYNLKGSREKRILINHLTSRKL